MVWLLRDGLPVPLAVTTGISDGRRTEILVGDLSPGTAVITGSLEPSP
jgi:HlyD family secretion protein